MIPSVEPPFRSLSLPAELLLVILTVSLRSWSAEILSPVKLVAVHARADALVVTRSLVCTVASASWHLRLPRIARMVVTEALAPLVLDARIVALTDLAVVFVRSDRRCGVAGHAMVAAIFIVEVSETGRLVVGHWRLRPIRWSAIEAVGFQMRPLLGWLADSVIE